MVKHVIWSSWMIWGAKWVKNTYYLYIWPLYSLWWVLSYWYNWVGVAHCFLPYRYDSLSYQYNFLWDAYYFFCYIQNSFCHAFNRCVMGIICSVIVINHPLITLWYTLSVVHNSAMTHCYFGFVVPPTGFAVS